MRYGRLTLCAAGALLLLTSTARAQDQTVRDVVTFLVTNQAVQTGDFVKDREAAEATSDTLSRALLASLATLPTGASSAGFTYRFNPTLGTLERTTTNFGPAFVERAITSGEGRVAMGATWQYARFSKLDGLPLREGTLVTIANRFSDEPGPFDVERLRLDVETSIVTAFATVGVTDRLDLAVAIPYIWLSLEGERVNDYRGTELVQASGLVSATGFGDVSLRGKYDLFSGRSGGFAAAAEIRLPTGREEDLLGSGRRFFRALAIASVEGPLVSAHANLAWGQGGISDELSYAAGVSLAAAPRFTVSGEIIGRSLADVGSIVETIAPHPTVAGVETLRLTVLEDSRLSVVSGVGSIKWNVSETWLLKASVITSLDDGGLTAPVSLTLGLDYAFGG